MFASGISSISQHLISHRTARPTLQLVFQRSFGMIHKYPDFVAHLPPEQRSQAKWSGSNIRKWKNKKGEKALSKIMPDVVAIAKERRPHLFEESSEEPVSEDSARDLRGLSESSAETSAVVSEDAEARELASVPNFARFAEFRKKDVDFEAEKLHCVYRVKSMSGRPVYEKVLMVELGLDRPINTMVILKNTPEINAKLWLVKHLLRMKPLSCPDGAPTEEECKGMVLKRNGQFVRSKLYRDMYKRPRGRPELEKFVLLRTEKEKWIRHKWFHGSLDGSLLPHLPADGKGVNITQDGGDLPRHHIPGSDKWD